MKIKCPKCGVSSEVFRPGMFQCECGNKISIQGGAPEASASMIQCPCCGNSISNRASSCPKCGNPVQSNDKPSIVLIVLLYLIGFCIPLVGMWIVILITSILYYAWKSNSPVKAKIINKHGWIIFLISLIFNSLYFMLK